MVETTTVRVRAITRAMLNEEVDRTEGTADAVILAGLHAVRRERLRRQFEYDARRASQDPDDRAEVAAAIRDLVGHE